MEIQVLHWTDSCCWNFRRFLYFLNNLLNLTNDNDLINSINSMSPESYSAFQSVGLETIKDRRDLLVSNAGNCTRRGIILNAKDNDYIQNPLLSLLIQIQSKILMVRKDALHINQIDSQLIMVLNI